MNTSPACCANRRSRGRNYEAELQRCHPEALPVEFGDYHPLKPIMVSPASCYPASNSVKPADPIHKMTPLCFPPGHGHKDPPWSSQRQHLLIFLLLVLSTRGPPELHAGRDRSPVHVCRHRDVSGCVTQQLRGGQFTSWPGRRKTKRGDEGGVGEVVILFF